MQYQLAYILKRFGTCTLEHAVVLTITQPIFSPSNSTFKLERFLQKIKSVDKIIEQYYIPIFIKGLYKSEVTLAASVMIHSLGSSERTLKEATSENLNVLEAICSASQNITQTPIKTMSNTQNNNHPRSFCSSHTYNPSPGRH